MQIRVSEAEHELLKKAAGGTGMSRFVLAKALAGLSVHEKESVLTTGAKGKRKCGCSSMMQRMGAPVHTGDCPLATEKTTGRD